MPGPDELLQAAEIARRQGDPRRAAHLARQAAALAPRSAPAWRALGAALAPLTEPAARAERIEALEHARALQPDHAPTLVNLATAHAAAGQPDAALPLLRHATELHPALVPAWFNLANTLRTLGRLRESERAYRRALDLQPDHRGTLRNLANTLIDLRRLDEARDLLLRHIGLERTPERLIALARLEVQRRDAPAARRLITDALTLEPHHPDAELLLATLERADGHLDDAIARLRRLIESPAPDAIRSTAFVQLGHALDRAGQYDDAFAAFSAGQSMLAARAPDTIARARASRAHIRTWADLIEAAAPPRVTVAPSPQPPVFLVGFPRSGTTLLEQILGAHPHFVTSDERPLLQRAMGAWTPPSGRPAAWPQCIGELDADAITRIRTAYDEVCIEELGDDARARRVVDKQPLNLIYADAIDRIFPDARIIVALRDARDVCLSGFFQDFGANAAAHFHDLDAATDLYDAVMGYWLRRRAALAIPWLEVRYEDLTDDFPTVARRLIEFTGAPWDDAVLEFARTAARRPVSTPSAHDVTQGVYRRAVRRWTRYEAWIRPFQPRLQRYLEAFDHV